MSQHETIEIKLPNDALGALHIIAKAAGITIDQVVAVCLAQEVVAKDAMYLTRDTVTTDGTRTIKAWREGTEEPPAVKDSLTAQATGTRPTAEKSSAHVQAPAEAPNLPALCDEIAKHLGSGWLVIGPDGSRFQGPTPHRAANAASKHYSRMAYDPAKAAELEAVLAEARRKSEEENDRLVAEFGSLNCPACGGSGHVGDTEEGRTNG